MIGLAIALYAAVAACFTVQGIDDRGIARHGWPVVGFASVLWLPMAIAALALVAIDAAAARWR